MNEYPEKLTDGYYYYVRKSNSFIEEYGAGCTPFLMQIGGHLFL